MSSLPLSITIQSHQFTHILLHPPPPPPHTHTHTHTTVPSIHITYHGSHPFKVSFSQVKVTGLLCPPYLLQQLYKVSNLLILFYSPPPPPTHNASCIQITYHASRPFKDHFHQAKVKGLLVVVHRNLHAHLFLQTSNLFCLGQDLLLALRSQSVIV